MVTHTCYCCDWMEWLTNFSFFFPILNNLKVLPLHWGVISFFCFHPVIKRKCYWIQLNRVKWLHLMWSPWFKWSVFKVRNFFSSLTPISDQEWISPNNFETTLSRQVMRIKKNMNSNIYTKFSKTTSWELYGRQ